MVMPFLALDRTPSAYVPQSLYIPIHFSMAAVGTYIIRRPQHPQQHGRGLCDSTARFPKWIKYLFLFIVIFSFGRIKLFEYIYLYDFGNFDGLIFLLIRWCAFALVLSFFSLSFSASSSSTLVPLHAFCLSSCVCSFCYLLCAIATTLCHFQNWNSYYLLSFFFSSSSSHFHSALSAAAVFVWCVCVCSWVELCAWLALNAAPPVR